MTNARRTVAAGMQGAIMILLAASSVSASSITLSATAGGNNASGSPCNVVFPGGTSSNPINANTQCIQSSGTAFAAPGQLGVSMTAVGAGSGLLTAGGGLATYEDSLVFTSSDPLATTAVVQLVMDLAGNMNSAFEASGFLKAAVSLNGVTYGLELITSEGTATTCTETGMSGTGVCASFSAGGPYNGSFIGVPVLVSLNAPIRLDLTLETNGGAIESGNVNADFSHTFAFPSGANVFILPAGVTVNAPDSYIVNNRFAPPNATTAVPEPATFGLLAGGVSMLIGRFTRTRRRRTQRAFSPASSSPRPGR